MRLDSYGKDREKKWAFVKCVMNIWKLRNMGSFWIINVCYAIMDHTNKLLVNAFLVTTFGPKIEPTSSHKSRIKIK